MRKWLITLCLYVSIVASAAGPSGTLPILYINTADGEPITSKETYLNGTYWLDPMGDDTMDALGSESKPLELQIRGRGNYTWTLDKKPYRIKLGSKAKFMGMNKSKHFVLLAHADDDHGYLREPLAFKLSELLGMPWTPDHRPVELVLNGEYMGLYFAVENIRIAKDRVNIVDQEEEAEELGASTDVTGGWLVEIDNYRETNQVTVREANGCEVWITHHSPEEVTREQQSFLLKEMFNIAIAAYDTDPDATRLGELVDMEALARFYVHSDILENKEAFNGSWYFHRDRGADKKWIAGPVWDFGQTLWHEGKKITEDCPWGCKLMPGMINNNELRANIKRIFSAFAASGKLYELFDYIDAYSKKIEAATASDGQRWPQYNRSDTRQQSSWVRDHVYERYKWIGRQWDVKLDTVLPGKGSHLYMRGTHTAWNAWSEWQFVNGPEPGMYDLYDVTLEGEGMYKIADVRWHDNQNWGYRSKSAMPSDADKEVIAGSDSKDITFKAGHYDLIRLIDHDGRHGTLHAYTHYAGVDNVTSSPSNAAPELIGCTLTAPTPFTVYSLTGAAVARDVTTVTLSPGFYIAANRKYLVK